MKLISKQTALSLSVAIAIALVFAPAANAQSASTKSKTTTKSAAKAPAAPTAKSTLHPTETVEYKDPEDMTTRYRPGNNKTTAVSPDATKPVSNGKEKVTFPACDGASKDAAKCAAPPPTPPSAQAAKHKGSIESIAIHQ